jgi:signal transduction histidine kinase
VRLSLRVRVLALVFLLNLLVFGMGGVLVLRTQIDSNQDLENQITEDLLATIKRTIRPDGLNVARILSWHSWSFFEDVILVDQELDLTAAGRIHPRGIALNPVGVRNRQGGFDKQAALAAIRAAISAQEPIEDVEGGRVVPISGPRGEPFGGIWFRTPDRIDEGALLRRVLPWFALSTLGLTLLTFFAMRRLVLDPISALGEGARRVSSGDLSVRLPEPSRRDEMADLVRSFNQMTSTVQGFNDRLEEEVRRATELARQAEAAAMTQRRLAAMGELAAGIAHEINNPLGGLQNAVTTLDRDDLEPEKRRRYLSLLATGLQRIGETVNRLRRFSPRPALHEPVDLEEVVRDSIELVRHRAERIGVRFGLEGARNELGQALLNLFSNSLDAFEDGKPDQEGWRIDVALAPAQGGVALRVRDNGPGVTQDELARVQDLFYTTKEVGKGTGLGLALVHSTVVQHGGSVRIASRRGHFFEAELFFPLGERSAES